MLYNLCRCSERARDLWPATGDDGVHHTPALFGSSSSTVLKPSLRKRWLLSAPFSARPFMSSEEKFSLHEWAAAALPT